MITSRVLELVTALTRPVDRSSAADALARELGGRNLIILVCDPELGVHLPAPGFSQTLPRGREWKALTKEALAGGIVRGELSYPTPLERLPAAALSTSDNSVLVVLGGRPHDARLEEARLLLPLVSATFRQELTAHIAVGNAALAREAANQARALTAALENVRRELVEAIIDRDLALQAGNMGTWHWDAETDTAEWSEIQEQLFGLAPRTYDGSGEVFYRLVDRQDHDAVRAGVAHSVATGEAYRARYRVHWPNGELHWLDAQGNVVRNEKGVVIGLTGVSWDVTEQKQAEEALARQAENLARSNADLQQFAYVTSHDLQEPLRNIVIYAQMLATRYQDRLDPKATQFLDYILTSGRRMAALVQGLLSFSQVTNADEVPPAPVNLDETLHWARMNLSGAIENSKAEVRSDPLPVVMGDRVQLVQVFQNLISNAIKYRASDPPRVDVSAVSAGDQWVISVQDNGLGIQPDYHERIFGIFKRLHGQHIPGTGIGLSICKKIIERHGGTIWVESEGEQSGARFRFTLPAVPGTGLPAKRSGATSPSLEIPRC